MAVSRGLHLLALVVSVVLSFCGSASAQTPPAALVAPSGPVQVTPPSTSAPPMPALGLRGGDAATTGPLPLNPPTANAQAAPMPHLRPGEVALHVSARFASNMPVTGGLHWRVYADKPDQSGMFRLLKEERSASPTFALPAGGYVVHVVFGLASAIKSVQLREEPVREVFDLSAGGLRLEGRVGDTRIQPGHISFEIYKGSQFDIGDKRPIVSNVSSGEIVLVPEGTYFFVSKYGDGNSIVRSDIRVQAGKLTDVAVTHRAAVITLKLVNRKDGETLALANTDWVVASPAGDVITETKGAFPRVILAEGEYRVIARNDNKTYPMDIKVITGVDREIEVLAR